MHTSNEYWQLFLETGAPECYLLFRSTARMEEQGVFQDTGTGPSPDAVQ